MPFMFILLVIYLTFWICGFNYFIKFGKFQLFRFQVPAPPQHTPPHGRLLNVVSQAMNVNNIKFIIYHMY